MLMNLHLLRLASQQMAWELTAFRPAKDRLAFCRSLVIAGYGTSWCNRIDGFAGWKTMPNESFKDSTRSDKSHVTAAFAQTRWTLVLRARGDSADAKAALSDLCAAYY